ncbi:MAG: peptide ABC transporter substrate-binding protein [Aridibacter famidurans]|nr:peptide ABC transporter substrate-binding protein [Aridibacter famidurans]
MHGIYPAGSKAHTRVQSVFVCLAVLSAAILFGSCGQLDTPKPEVFYSETEPPRAQEFRWSNGRMPGSFDPLKAAAPPETDLVRAIYEGLTEIDPKTLEALPAVALKWEAADDGREWTFELRSDAKWTNGDKVTAEDFVRSWKRAAEAGKEAAHFAHISNIKGFKDPLDEGSSAHAAEDLGKPGDRAAARNTGVPKLFQNQTPGAAAEKGETARAPEAAGEAEEEIEFGAVAVEPHILKVYLKKPDAQFPKLAAHPVLRPVHGDGKALEGDLRADIVTNGAFAVASVEQDGVVLDRSETYFAKSSVKLEKIRFVVAKDADTALAEYRAGKVDAVTNTEFEPLALKLLTPYVDFRRTKHSALNFYEFNRTKAPFHDRRVREALAIAIDRKRLAEDLTDGAMEPAYGFLPFEQNDDREKIEEDVERAKDLLQKAGFGSAEGFPVIRLVINRNDLQQKIAKEVASMWKENLGIEADIVVREFEEMEAVWKAGDYDLIRRGAVLPTSDETANMLAIFGTASNERTEKAAGAEGREVKGPVRYPDPPPPLPDANLGLTEFDGLPPSVRDELTIQISDRRKAILTEEAAVFEVPAIPLYFPTSYSLVKPYVLGFDTNPLDAPLLRSVSIDSGWKSDPNKGP